MNLEEITYNKPSSGQKAKVICMLKRGNLYKDLAGFSEKVS